MVCPGWSVIGAAHRSRDSHPHLVPPPVARLLLILLGDGPPIHRSLCMQPRDDRTNGRAHRLRLGDRRLFRLPLLAQLGLELEVGLRGHSQLLAQRSQPVLRILALDVLGLVARLLHLRLVRSHPTQLIARRLCVALAHRRLLP